MCRNGISSRTVAWHNCAVWQAGWSVQWLSVCPFVHLRLSYAWCQFACLSLYGGTTLWPVAALLLWLVLPLAHACRHASCTQLWELSLMCSDRLSAAVLGTSVQCCWAAEDTNILLCTFTCLPVCFCLCYASCLFANMRCLLVSAMRSRPTLAFGCYLLFSSPADTFPASASQQNCQGTALDEALACLPGEHAHTDQRSCLDTFADWLKKAKYCNDSLQIPAVRKSRLWTPYRDEPVPHSKKLALMLL